MPRACCLIRTMPAYRREAFVSGLRAAGYEVHEDRSYQPRPDDLLLIWSRYGDNAVLARRYEKTWASVVVAENGYLGREWRGSFWYAVTNRNPNIPALRSDPERWDGLGVELQPWRADGDYILVLAQRGIGPPGIAQPHGWAYEAAGALGRMTKRQVKIRHHPGETVPRTSLADDLRRAWACVTWSSGAGIKALLAGVPVFYGLKHWVGAEAALPFGSDVEKPFLGDRRPMFRRLAWSIWEVGEIAAGEPFKMVDEAKRDEVEAQVKWLGDVQRLKLQPGDVVVVSCEQPLSRDAGEHIKALVRKNCPGNEVLVLSGGLKIGVLGKSA